MLIAECSILKSLIYWWTYISTSNIYGNQKFVFTDSKKAANERLNIFNNIETAVFRVPSFGSFINTKPQTIANVSPKNIVISAKNESKGYESDVFSSVLEKVGIKTHKTSKNGAVIFKTDGLKTELVDWD